MFVIFLSSCVAIVMFGLGLSLTTADFMRIYRRPVAILIGLGLQLLVLPALCFLLASVMAPRPEIAVGMMLLAATPGGPMANLFSYFAGGEIALNISLEACGTLLSIITVPALVNTSVLHFMRGNKLVPMQLSQVVQICALIIVPTAIGMITRHRHTAFAERIHLRVKQWSIGILLTLSIVAFVLSASSMPGFLLPMFGAAVILSAAVIGAGYLLPLVLGQPRSTAIAIATETTIHNVPLAVAIALNPLLLGDPLIAAFPVIYGFVSVLLTVAIGVAAWHRRQLVQA